jgi:3-hydroxyacyl-CoA dehydrogenase / enoyl-CoA hydratase / 3-hydroxybutyryl-CoA epimerase
MTATSANFAGTTNDILTVERDGNVAVMVFDLAGEPVNKLSAAAREAFEQAFSSLQADASVTGIVFISGKPDSFIAGADIDELAAVKFNTDAERLSTLGHEMLERIANGKPVVAAIHGACMGGGLEVALACHYRIVSDSPKTILALPEVQLGLIPGAGGTQRLPRIVGLANALDMILTGKNIRAKKAFQMGLADELVHPKILRRIAVDRARALGDGSLERTPRRTNAQALLLEENPLGRSVVFKKAREGVMQKTKGKYPAPLKAIESVMAGYSGGMEAGYRAEARMFGELAVTPESKALVSLFYATTALKKDPGTDVPVDAASLAPIEKIAILGAGFMGAGIASIAVQQGTLVRLKDADLARVGKGYAAIREVLGERLKKKQVTRVQYDDMMSLVGGTVDYSGFGNVDLVIEAVFEDLNVKHQVLREVEAVAPHDVIFASNTSTIPIGRIAEASRRPERVLGMHFFSPVHKMPLLEVIVTPRTAPEVTARVVAYGKKLGKTVIVVNDGPGFYANRILTPYINEAGKMLDEGAAVDAIDRALTSFGYPVGPITLIDEVGLDIAAKSGTIMTAAFPDRMAPSKSLERVIADGRLGRKGRKGFYQYDEQGKKGEVDQSIYALLPMGAVAADYDAEDIQRRAVFAMLNEAARCLEDGIIRSPRDGDIGAVFGIGFPPFLGGPFRYMDSLGENNVVRTLEELESQYGPRFTPAPILVDMARSGRRFYPVTQGA